MEFASPTHDTVPDPNGFIGKRIAKKFDDSLFFGTIKEYHPVSDQGAPVWTGIYDDGDVEDYFCHQMIPLMRLQEEHATEDPLKEHTTEDDPLEEEEDRLEEEQNNRSSKKKEDESEDNEETEEEGKRDSQMRYVFRYVREEVLYLREKRMLRQREEHELNKFYGAMAMLWHPKAIRKWNKATSDPSDDLFVACPKERHDWAFKSRHVKRFYFAAKKTIMSADTYDGIHKRAILRSMTPKLIGKALDNDSRAFQLWAHRNRIVDYAVTDREWADKALDGLKSFINEFWP